MNPDAWDVRERTLPGVFAEAARLFRRARRRWWVSLAAAAVVAVLAVVYAYRRNPPAEGRIVVRVVEGVVDAQGDARDEDALVPPRELRDFILEVVFSKTRLLELAKRHDLETTLLALDQERGIAEIRSNIGLEVVRNYFLMYRPPGSPPRSARIVISYRDTDPELVMAVVKDLGELLAEQESRRRDEDTRKAALQAKGAADSLRAKLHDEDEDLARLRFSMASVTPEASSARQLDIARLEVSILADTALLSSYERRAADSAALRDLVGTRLALRFEVARVLEPTQERHGVAGLAFLGVLAFVLVLPLCALCAGAFDPRVYDVDDVRRLGLEPLGHVGYNRAS